MIVSPRKLLELGIVGINRRNADYIMRYNRRSHYPLVDDKILTKRLAIENDIAVPPLYDIIEIEQQVQNLRSIFEKHDQFVVKPASGSGGSGVLVITGMMGKNYRKSNGLLITERQVAHHISNILSGMHSLGGAPDRAMVEYMVKFDPLFDSISYQGVPDIRVVVFRGVPLAAMIRLPTRASDGKANLHQGAIGVGIDLVTGLTGAGVWHNEIMHTHPDTGMAIAGINVAPWQRILELAASCADIVGLGYLGVDIVLDRDLGPLVLELNARPGLNVQLATGRGLLHNLRKIEAIKELPNNPTERVALAQELLG